MPALGAHGYLPGTGTVPVDVTTWNPSAAGAAGAIISTASDLSRFYRALLTGDLLPPAQVILASTLDSPAVLQAQESQIAGLLCG